MGVTLSYQAIPPTSDFYKRVQRERKLNILLQSFFCLAGIFDTFDINSFDNHCLDNDSIETIDNELAEFVEDIIEQHYDVFSSEVEVNLAITEYRHELMRTRRDFPGIEDRWASLEKTGAVIESRLSDEFQRRNFPEYILSSMMYGDGGFDEDLWTIEDKSLSLISRETVREGASILRQIDPQDLLETIEDGFDEACLENFAQWRNLYIEADKNGDEILMDVLRSDITAGKHTIYRSTHFFNYHLLAIALPSYRIESSKESKLTIARSIE